MILVAIKKCKNYNAIAKRIDGITKKLYCYVPSVQFFTYFHLLSFEALTYVSSYPIIATFIASIKKLLKIKMHA